MEFFIDAEGSDHIVRLSGDLSFRNQAHFETALDALFAAEAARFIIDLGEVSFMDSTGMGLLFVALSLGKEHAAPVILKNPSPPVAHSLAHAKTQEIFTIEG